MSSVLDTSPSSFKHAYCVLSRGFSDKLSGQESRGFVCLCPERVNKKVAQKEYLLWNTFLHVDAKGRTFSKPEASVYEQLYAYIDASVLEALSAGILAHKDFNTMVAIKSFQDLVPI